MGNACILIVDDEVAIATTLAFALKSEGFETRHALLAQDALQIQRSESVDLAIVDIGLPDMSGFELCKALRKVSDIPVVFLTARNDEVDRIVGLEIGADDYVTKPFSPREVVARVKVILKRVRAPRVRESEPRAKAERWFQVDVERAKIHFLSSPLDLTKSEYLMLKGLLAVPGHVCSRAQIMAFISADPASSLERTVDAHIKSVRVKLRSISTSVDPIETHRGLGYSIRNDRV